MPQPPPRGHPRRWSALVLLVALGPVAPLLSCSGDNPVEPSALTPDPSLEGAAAKGGGSIELAEDALSIQDMLSDPLFQTLVRGVDEPTLAEPLLAAVDALASGQTAKATNLIGRASAAADALEDGPLTEALILWSAVVRYFEEAELI